MKKYLFLLLAACCLVACEDEFGSIDELSPAEFEQYLDSGEGLNFLVKLAQGKEIDYQAIENKLETTHTLTESSDVYIYRGGRWEKSMYYGLSVSYFTSFADKSVVRICFNPIPSAVAMGNYFRDISFEGPVVEYVLTNNMTYMDECKVIAQLNEKTLVVEGISEGVPERRLLVLEENRAEILAKHTDPYPY